MTGTSIGRTVLSRLVATPTTGPANASSARLDGLALGITRIVVSFMFAWHGYQKLFGAFGRDAVAVGLWPSWWAGIIELFCGGLVLLGLFTRPAAILCSGAMAYAYFVVHQPLGLLPIQNNGELAAVYSWVFLLIAVLGPGAFALDTMRRRRAEAAITSP
jgi:putative oxidoreductase